MDISSLLIPLLLTAAALWGLGRRMDVYDALTAGAAEGLTVLLRIVPSLIALLTAVYMFRASGALALLARLLSPALEALGIPPETAALRIICGTARLFGEQRLTELAKCVIIRPHDTRTFVTTA